VRDGIGLRSIALLILADEIANGRRRVVDEVVIRVEAAFKRLAADLEELRRLPSIAPPTSGSVMPRSRAWMAICPTSL